MQGNPLGYSAISALVNGIFHFPVGFWSVRIPSLAGGLMVILAGGWIAKKFNFNRSHFFLWAALIIFSPLIWVYAGRATADVLPTGLLMLSLAHCLKADENKIYNFIASVVFSISILVKYNSLLILPGFFYLFYLQNNGQLDSRFLKDSFLFIMTPLAGLVIYWWTIYERFGIFVFPEHSKAFHRMQWTQFGNVFSLYSGYLVLLAGPLSFVSVFYLIKTLKYKNLVWIVLAGVCLSFISYLVPSENLEMNFGPIHYFVNDKVDVLIKILGSFLFCFFLADVIRDAWINNNRFARLLLFIIIPYLIASSLTRPAQRYLIFLVPLLIMFFVFHRLDQNSGRKNFLGWGTVIIFVFLNLFSVNYQVAQANASERMAQWLIKHEMIQETHQGSIASHSGNYFMPFYQLPKTHSVTQTPDS